MASALLSASGCSCSLCAHICSGIGERAQYVRISVHCIQCTSAREFCKYLSYQNLCHPWLYYRGYIVCVHSCSPLSASFHGKALICAVMQSIWNPTSEHCSLDGTFSKSEEALKRVQMVIVTSTCLKNTYTALKDADLHIPIFVPEHC